MNAEFIEALNALEKEKGISKDVLLSAVESALIFAYKRNYNSQGNVRAEVDGKTGEMHIYASKTVVETVENPTVEISMEGIEEKSLTATSIEFDKLPSGLYAIAPDGGLTVRLWGLSEEIEAVTAENLRVIADMSAVTGQGTVTVPVTVTISGFNDVTVRGTYELTVTVTDVAPTVPETAEGAAASHPAA